MPVTDTPPIGTKVGTTDLQQRLGLNYGVTIGINLFDGFNKRREQRNARLEIQNKELRMQELRISLRADLSNLWMAYKNNLSHGSWKKKPGCGAREL